MLSDYQVNLFYSAINNLAKSIIDIKRLEIANEILNHSKQEYRDKAKKVINEIVFKEK